MAVEKEPTGSGLQSESFVIPELSSQSFHRQVSEVELTLEDVQMSDKAKSSYIDYKTRVLSDLFGQRFVHEKVDMIAEGWLADEDEDGDIVGFEDIFSLNAVTYEGIRIVRINSIGNAYQVMLKFSDSVVDPETGQLVTESYFVRPQQTIKFQENLGGDKYPRQEIMQAEFLNVIVESEDIVHSDEFKNATRPEQNSMLDNITSPASERLVATYRNAILAIEVTEFYIIRLSDQQDGCYDIVSNASDSEPGVVTGKFVFCSYVEEMLPCGDEVLDRLDRDYPSMVLQDRKTGLVYLIPYKAIGNIEVMEEQEP